MNKVAMYKKREERWLTVLAYLISVSMFLVSAPSSPRAEDIQQKSFASPADAAKSLVAAFRADDMQEVIAILGAGSRELIYSGDEVADRVGREKFIKAYDKMNIFQQESADKTALCVGTDKWPLPIPIVKKGEAWVFDIQEGKQEILNRRIGGNELRVMDVLHAYIGAQHEYASKDFSGNGLVEFAQRLISTKGKKDGLYWDVKEGEEESPLGPLIAQAAKEGYPEADLQPFQGYYYRILKSQGKHADGGAYDYVVNGKMILGFALVAYPAEFGNSGIMTFIVNQDGVIYETNLGEETKRITEAMEIFDPDETWWTVGETAKQE